MHHKEDAGALHEDVVAIFSKVNLSIYELRDFWLGQLAKGLVIAGCMATSHHACVCMCY